jgi:uncharacterized protein HemY
MAMSNVERAMTRRIVQLETENEKLKQIKDYRSPSDNKSALTTVRDVEFLVNVAMKQQMQAIATWHKEQHSLFYRVGRWINHLVKWIAAHRREKKATNG